MRVYLNRFNDWFGHAWNVRANPVRMNAALAVVTGVIFLAMNYKVVAHASRSVTKIFERNTLPMCIDLLDPRILERSRTIELYAVSLILR